MPRLTIALNANDTIQFIDEVPGGINCGCFCPSCRSPLVAKKGQINEWHFAHEPGQERPDCLVGALNLFARFLLEHLLVAGVGIPVQGLKGVTLRAIKPINEVATGGLAELSDGRQFPVQARVQEHRRSSGLVDGTEHLLYSCQTPTPEVLKDRQSANSFITRYASLDWRGNQPQTSQREWSALVDKKLNLQPGVGSPVMVYPLKNGSDWIMYKNRDGCFVLRQWPEPGHGWETRFAPGVGTANLDAGAYEVKDFLTASASLRPLVRKSGLQCLSLDLVQRVLDSVE